MSVYSKNADLERFMTSSFLYGVAMTVTGILFCAFKSELVSVLLTIVGVFAILLGAAELVKKHYAEGAAEVAVGIIVIACGWTVVNITLLILGVCFIAYAVYSVICSLPKLKGANAKQAIFILSSPALLTIFGALLIAARWKTVDALFIAGGVLLIVTGIVMMLRRDTRK